MHLYIILDLQKKSWANLENSSLLLNNLFILINTFLLFSFDNEVIIINNLKKIIFNNKNKKFDKNYKFNFNDKKNTLINDLSLTFLLTKNYEFTKILIISLSQEKKEDFLKYLKTIFISNRYFEKYKIYIYSKFKNSYLNSNFIFFENFELKNLLKIFTNKEKKCNYQKMYCFCHKNEILYGLVCPICLAVYCKFVAICKQCRVRFKVVGKSNLL